MTNDLQHSIEYVRQCKLAQLRSGCRVKIVRLIDEAANPKALGRRGKVLKTQTFTGDHGATEDDPMWCVAYTLDGLRVTDYFWTEELEVVLKKGEVQF